MKIDYDVSKEEMHLDKKTFGCGRPLSDPVRAMVNFIGSKSKTMRIEFDSVSEARDAYSSMYMYSRRNNLNLRVVSRSKSVCVVKEEQNENLD